MFVGVIFGVFVLVIFVSILIFMEIEFIGIILDKKDYKLKKGVGYNLDLFVLGLLVGLCLILGLFWMCVIFIYILFNFYVLIVISINYVFGEYLYLIGVKE